MLLFQTLPILSPFADHLPAHLQGVERLLATPFPAQSLRPQKKLLNSLDNTLEFNTHLIFEASLGGKTLVTHHCLIKIVKKQLHLYY